MIAIEPCENIFVKSIDKQFRICKIRIHQPLQQEPTMTNSEAARLFPPIDRTPGAGVCRHCGAHDESHWDWCPVIEEAEMIERAAAFSGVMA